MGDPRRVFIGGAGNFGLDGDDPSGNASAEDMAFVSARLREADAPTFVSTCTVLSHGMALRGGAGMHTHNQAAAAAAGVLEALVAGTARHGAGSADAAQAGVMAINNLCVGNAPNRARALQAGALTPILEALRLGAVAGGELSAELAEVGAMAVYSLTAHSDVAVGAATRGGAVEAVMACVGAHAGRADVLVKAFSALFNMTARTQGPAVDAAARATRAGAVEAVAAALRAHGGNGGAGARPEAAGEFVHWCAALLSSLTGRGLARGDADARAARCGAGGALRAAAARHVGDRHVAGEVAQALCGLSFSYDDAGDERLQVLRLLTATLRALPRDVDVTASACEAADVLLGTAAPGCVQRCGESGAGVAAVRALAAALRAHAASGQPELLAHACGALARLVGAAPREAGAAAARCGADDALAALPRGAAEPHTDTLTWLLRVACAAHDAAPRCEPAAGEEEEAGGGCVRCEAQRAAGTLCGAPGCGARRRDGGAKALQRCSGCRIAAYCSVEHQRVAWGSGHKGACRALAARRGADAGGGAAA
jgi:hypothetical protein